MFKVGLVVALGCFIAVGCARNGGSNPPPAGPAAPNAQTQPLPKDMQPQPATQAQPDTSATTSEQPSQIVKKKKAKKAAKKPSTTPPTTTGQEEPTQTGAVEPQQPAQQPAAQPQAQARFVVGLGSSARKPEELYAQGYNAAIFEANFCRISGKFSYGSECYIQYNDGKTEWVNANNRDLITPFVDGLKAKRDAEKAAKAQKKSQKN